MPLAKHWRVDVYLTEDSDGRLTSAEARLHTQDATALYGRGQARKNPADASVPEIGDELACARALADLAQQLLHAAADDIEAMSAEPAHVR